MTHVGHGDLLANESGVTHLNTSRGSGKKGANNSLEFSRKLAPFVFSRTLESGTSGKQLCLVPQLGVNENIIFNDVMQLLLKCFDLESLAKLLQDRTPLREDG